MPEAQTPTAPAEVAPTAPAADQSTVSDPNPSDAEIDYRDRFEAMQKVNRDLEKKVKEDYVTSGRKAAVEEARALRDELAALKAKAEGKEAEFAKEQERRNVESAALAKANERILKAEIRGAAAKALADPTDALLYLDLSKFEVGNDGEVDTAAITSALADLVKAKPYLAAQSGTGVVFESPAAHRAAAKPGQLTQADLKGMTPAQINTARAEGRLNSVLGFKS